MSYAYVHTYVTRERHPEKKYEHICIPAINMNTAPVEIAPARLLREGPAQARFNLNFVYNNAYTFVPCEILQEYVVQQVLGVCNNLSTKKLKHYIQNLMFVPSVVC